MSKILIIIVICTCGLKGLLNLLKGKETEGCLWFIIMWLAGIYAKIG